MDEADVNALNPLVWAYAGDAVFTLAVRKALISRSDNKCGALHKACSALVNASAQSALLEGIQDRLNQKELEILRRARNAKPNNKAKNAAASDYRRATALEALFGYLYLSNNIARLDELMQAAVQNGIKNFLEGERNI